MYFSDASSNTIHQILTTSTGCSKASHIDHVADSYWNDSNLAAEFSTEHLPVFVVILLFDLHVLFVRRKNQLLTIMMIRRHLGLIATILSSTPGILLGLAIIMYLFGLKASRSIPTNGEPSSNSVVPLFFSIDAGISLSQAVLVLLYAIAVRLLLFGLPLQKVSHWMAGNVNLLKSTRASIVQVSSVEGLSAFKSCLSFTTLQSTLSSTSINQLVTISGGSNSDGIGKKMSKDIDKKTSSLRSIDTVLPKADISNLTLRDIKDVLRFVVDMNRQGWNKNMFLSKLSKNARKAVAAIEAIALSYTKSVQVQLSSRSYHYRHTNKSTMFSPSAEASGDTDALMFVIFVKLFAEWRALRLVPIGYQRYSMGMSLAKRDLLQNADNIETNIREYIADCQSLRTVPHGHAITSPTIKQLLQWEIDQKKHHKLPYLTDKTAASGLLWIQRQLQYQTSILRNISQIPSAFKNSKSAVLSAYAAVYEKYHGFMVRQLFQRTFDAAPDADAIIQYMNVPYAYNDNTPDYHGEQTSSSKQGINNSVGHDDSWVHLPLDTFDHRNDQSGSFVHTSKAIGKNQELMPSNHPSPNPIEKLGIHISREWSKFQRFLSQCNGESNYQNHYRQLELTTGSQPAFVNLSTMSPSSVTIVPKEQENHSTSSVPPRKSARDQHATKQKMDGSDDIPLYIGIAQPFLDGLDNLIVELNMKDPTKC